MARELGFTELGRSSLGKLPKNVQRDLAKSIETLPAVWASAKALLGPLKGLFSLRVRNRYRILYRMDEKAGRVVVEYVGERKAGMEDDVYEAARKLLKALS